MQGSLPAWFEADKVFSHKGRWYIGSQSGLHIGPYSDKEVAESKGLFVTKRLLRARSDGEKLRYVRELLREEWGSILQGSTDEDEVVLAEEIDLEPPPMEVRKGEPPRSWFRSSRFFKVDSVWFIATREGIDVGPFGSESEARRHGMRLIEQLAVSNSQDESYRIIYEYKHGPACDAA